MRFLAFLMAACIAGCGSSNGFSTDYSVLLPGNTSFTTSQDGSGFRPPITENGLDYSRIRNKPLTLTFDTGDVVVLRKTEISINGATRKPHAGSTVTLTRVNDKVILQ